MEGFLIMSLKKIMFSFMLGIVMVQEVQASSRRQPKQAKSIQRTTRGRSSSTEFFGSNPVSSFVNSNSGDNVQGFRRMLNSETGAFFINTPGGFFSQPPLHDAIMIYNSNPSPANREVVRLLLEAGADVNLENEDGDTAQTLSPDLMHELILENAEREQSEALRSRLPSEMTEQTNLRTEFR